MKQRLFWKILFAFGLTFFVMSQCVWLLFMAQRDVPLSPEDWTARQVAPPMLAMLAHTTAREGYAGFVRERLLLPEAYRGNIAIADAADAATAPGGGAIEAGAALARAPDGHLWRITYRYTRRAAPNPLAMPWQILVVVLFGGLFFSVILAWYLTRPIKLLREAFAAMAGGDLDVRLEARVGRRRDEIADLAKHFDDMAAHLGRLVTARDRLLHDVSHELRSPLSRLQLAIGLARQDPARVGSSLDRIDREARRLEGMLHELLILARAESDAARGDEYFDPLAALVDVIADARFEAQANAVSVIVTEPEFPEDDRPSIKGSAELFRRAMENIIRNALRFSPKQGQVEINIEIDLAQRIYGCVICDHGPGVRAEDMEAIFDPFVRIDVAGFGLGLAIARRAILAHCGSIEAYNIAPSGLAVDVKIPLSSV